jgi:hypothetical protein
MEGLSGWARIGADPPKNDAKEHCGETNRDHSCRSQQPFVDSMSAQRSPIELP